MGVPVWWHHSIAAVAMPAPRRDQLLPICRQPPINLPCEHTLQLPAHNVLVLAGALEAQPAIGAAVQQQRLLCKR